MHLQKTAFSLVKSSLALGLQKLFKRMHHVENGIIHRKMAINYPFVITFLYIGLAIEFYLETKLD